MVIQRQRASLAGRAGCKSVAPAGKTPGKVVNVGGLRVTGVSASRARNVNAAIKRTAKK